jgi:1,4-alpha-glucan branching enzyme
VRAHSEKPTRQAERVLKQMARELLLAQSSDWAFLIRNKTASDYATQRVTDHLVRFNRLQSGLATQNVDKNFLSECEQRDNLFPEVNWRYYA